MWTLSHLLCASHSMLPVDPDQASAQLKVHLPGPLTAHAPMDSAVESPHCDVHPGRHDVQNKDIACRLRFKMMQHSIMA